MGLDMYLRGSGGDIGSWRKANAIHGWMVREVQGGNDDQKEYEVPREKLLQLLGLCLGILNDVLTPEDLPPTEGFFFGSTAVDTYYYDDLRHTVKLLKEALSKQKEGHAIFYSSWW